MPVIQVDGYAVEYEHVFDGRGRAIYLVTVPPNFPADPDLVMLLADRFGCPPDEIVVQRSVALATAAAAAGGSVHLVLRRWRRVPIPPRPDRLVLSADPHRDAVARLRPFRGYFVHLASGTVERFLTQYRLPRNRGPLPYVFVSSRRRWRLIVRYLGRPTWGDDTCEATEAITARPGQTFEGRRACFINGANFTMGTLVHEQFHAVSHDRMWRGDVDDAVCEGLTEYLTCRALGYQYRFGDGAPIYRQYLDIIRDGLERRMYSEDDIPLAYFSGDEAALQRILKFVEAENHGARSRRF